MHLYLIILNDIHSKLPFLRNKFNFVTISFFHFQFRLVSSNPYISYFKSQNNTIYCSLALLHYSTSETKFNFVTISFFHFQFRLVSSNPYISYFKSQNNTIYCSLALLHYSTSETSGKHIAKRISTSFLSFITEFASFPI